MNKLLVSAASIMLLCTACTKTPKTSVTLVHGDTEKTVNVVSNKAVTGKMGFLDLEENTLWCTESDGRGEIIVSTEDMVLYPVGGLITVKTADDFKIMADKPGDIYLLENDITLSGEWEPPTDMVSLGTLSYGEFEGVFHGAGHIIKGLKQTQGYKSGLFGFLNGAYIRDLHIEGEIEFTEFDAHYAGLLAGIIEHSDIISISVKGSISVSSSEKPPLEVGGIGGWFYKSKLQGSSADVRIKTVDKTPHHEADRIGGLTGHNLWSIIEDSYAIASISTEGSNTVYTGGISGQNYLSEILRTHASVDIEIDYSGPEKPEYFPGISTDGTISAGGITGFSNTKDVSNNAVIRANISVNTDVGIAYYRGRIVGQMSGSMENNIADGTIDLIPATGLWLEKNEPKTDSAKTKDELKQQETYERVGWDFINVWKTGENGYPVLR